MSLHTEHKIHAINQHLDAFELWVIAHLTPNIDLTTLQAAVAALQEDVYSIVEMRDNEPETTPFELVEDTVLAAFFTVPPKT